LLLKKFKSALLGNIARLLELAERLEARGVLLLGHDAALLGLHQILLGQATGSVLGRSVPDLGLGASSHHSAAILLILASIHFYIQCGEYILEHGKSWNPSSQNLINQRTHFLGIVNACEMNEEISWVPKRCIRKTHQIRIEATAVMGDLDFFRI